MITSESNITINYIFKTDGHQVGETNKLTTIPTNEGLIIGVRDYLTSLINKLPEEVINQTTNLTLSPEESFGVKNPEMITAVPKTMLEGYKLNDNIIIHTTDGKDWPGIIKEENKDTFIVDCNHPLASKTIEVDITIIEVK